MAVEHNLCIFVCEMFAGKSPELPISPEMLISIHFGREMGLICQKISEGRAEFFGRHLVIF